TRLPATDIAAGILAAARAGRSVINLSLGSNQPDELIDGAIAEAVRLGSLVVAASGNSGQEGSPPSYPADDPHVLTVAATDQSDQVAPFSSQSQSVDIAAPGVDIPVATALDNSWALEDGTSFSSPLVAGAAAWLWTVRPDLDASQVAEILRESARDVGPPGFDTATGYGILDLTAALAAPTPQADSAEPNDDIQSAATVTTRSTPSGTTSGRVAQSTRRIGDSWLHDPEARRRSSGRRGRDDDCAESEESDANDHVALSRQVNVRVRCESAKSPLQWL
ncbi:MAG TPA: S8 family serine peptidase, partial [Gaiellaceae bacterium]